MEFLDAVTEVPTLSHDLVSSEGLEEWEFPDSSGALSVFMRSADGTVEVDMSVQVDPDEVPSLGLDCVFDWEVSLEPRWGADASVFLTTGEDLDCCFCTDLITYTVSGRWEASEGSAQLITSGARGQVILRDLLFESSSGEESLEISELISSPVDFQLCAY